MLCWQVILTLVWKRKNSTVRKLNYSFYKYISAKHWENLANQRLLFIEFAKKKGVNPLVPDSWYDLDPGELCSQKVQHLREDDNGLINT